MSRSPSPFEKKKNNFDFSDNAMMTSSVRASTKVNKDEVYLAMEKQLKKLKKHNKELSEKYENMKNYGIQKQYFQFLYQRVDLQMDIDELTQKISFLEEEVRMLMSRIKHLEKEASSVRKGYQRPLNRSISKSVMRNSHIQNFNTLNLKTQRSESSNTSLEDLAKTRRFTTECEDLMNQSSYVEGDTIEKISFDKKERNKRPLIPDEDNQTEEQCYCGNKRCIQNYKELQNLRRDLLKLGENMEKICIQIEYGVDRKLTYKDVADFKLKMQKVSKQYPDFCVKGKSEYLMVRLQQKMNEFVNSPNYKQINPLIAEVKQKLKQMKREEEEFREEMACQSYDFENQQKEIQKLALAHQKAMMNLKEIMVTRGIKNDLLQKNIKLYEDTREREWKKIGLA